MLNQSIDSVLSPIPPEFFSRSEPTVGLILIEPPITSVLLVQHSRDRQGSFLPPQGRFRPSERFIDAFLREFKEEFPDGQLDAGTICFLGDAENDAAPPERRDSSAEILRPKHIFWGAARLASLPTRLNEAELVGEPQYARSAWELRGFLDARSDERPKKRTMVLEAVGRAFDSGMLHSGFAPCAYRDLAAA